MLELICVSMRVCLEYILLPMDISCFYPSFSEETIFSPLYCLSSCQGLNYSHSCKSISGLSILFHELICLLSTNLTLIWRSVMKANENEVFSFLTVLYFLKDITFGKTCFSKYWNLVDIPKSFKLYWKYEFTEKYFLVDWFAIPICLSFQTNFYKNRYK